jgi:predicted XRE-type DNA-binding protein
MKMKNNAIGSSFDDFLAEEELTEEVEAGAIKKLIAYQLREAIEKEQLTKTALAAQLYTSRAAVNRLLDPENESITLLTLKRAAMVLGKKLHLQLL